MAGTLIPVSSSTSSLLADAPTYAAQAAASAAAAALSEAATAADVVTTNADVVLTNADVVLTHADVVLTNADVVSTNADAVATAADRVQTGLDVIQTAADVVSASAVLASAVPRTSTTGAAVLPVGTTAQRDGVPLEGYLRRNSELGQWEGYDGSVWTGLGGATGGGGNPMFYENDQLMTADYTIPAGKNAMATGPITVDTGVTLNVSAGATLKII